MGKVIACAGLHLEETSRQTWNSAGQVVTRNMIMKCIKKWLGTQIYHFRILYSNVKPYFKKKTHTISVKNSSFQYV